MLILQNRFISTKNKASRAAAMICISTLSLFSPAIAQTPSNPDREIALAREKYVEGKFDEAIERLNRCMREGGLSEA